MYVYLHVPANERIIQTNAHIYKSSGEQLIQHAKSSRIPCLSLFGFHRAFVLKVHPFPFPFKLKVSISKFVYGFKSTLMHDEGMP